MSIMINLGKRLSCCDCQCSQESEAFEGLSPAARLNSKDWQTVLQLIIDSSK